MIPGKELSEQFYLVTRKGWRQFQNQNAPNKNKASKHGGLYFQREQRHREYAPKFKKQYERFLTNERRTKEKQRTLFGRTIDQQNDRLQQGSKTNWSVKRSNSTQHRSRSHLRFTKGSSRNKKEPFTRKQRVAFEKLIREHLRIIHATNDKAKHYRPSRTRTNLEKRKKEMKKAKVDTHPRRKQNENDETFVGKLELLHDLANLRKKIQLFLSNTNRNINTEIALRNLYSFIAKMNDECGIIKESINEAEINISSDSKLSLLRHSINDARINKKINKCSKNKQPVTFVDHCHSCMHPMHQQDHHCLSTAEEVMQYEMNEIGSQEQENEDELETSWSNNFGFPNIPFASSKLHAGASRVIAEEDGTDVSPIENKDSNEDSSKLSSIYEDKSLIYKDDEGRTHCNPLAKLPDILSYDQLGEIIDPLLFEMTELTQKMQANPTMDPYEIQTLYSQIKDILIRLLTETEYGKTQNKAIDGLLAFAKHLHDFTISCHDAEIARNERAKAKKEEERNNPEWFSSSLKISGFVDFIKSAKENGDDDGDDDGDSSSSDHSSIDDNEDNNDEDNINNVSSPNGKKNKTKFHDGDDGDGDDSSSSSSDSSHSSDSSDSSEDDESDEDEKIDYFTQALGIKKKADSKNKRKKSKSKKKVKNDRKKKGSKKHRKRKEDKRYRDIIKVLSKNSSNFHIKPFSIHQDPQTRREMFKNWIIDISNVLSTHWRTDGILKNYPSKVNKIKCKGTDRAIKAILFSSTKNHAKELVGAADSAYDALLSLKRNCSLTGAFDKHTIRQKMFSLKQEYGEKATEFLRRVSKQATIAESLGCKSFGEEEMVVSIILQGLNPNIRLYSAELANKRATFLRDPKSVTVNLLEETFFSIDNSASYNKNSSTNSSSNFKRRGNEQANYTTSSKSSNNSSNMNCFICGSPNHIKRDCPKRNNKQQSTNSNNNNKGSYNNGKKKDLSHIICVICKKPGHYPNQCPERTRKGRENDKNKTVTFESAHIVQEYDEHCAFAIEDSNGLSISNLETYLDQLSTSENDNDTTNCDDSSSSDSSSSSSSSDPDSLPDLVARDCCSSSSDSSSSSSSSFNDNISWNYPSNNKQDENKRTEPNKDKKQEAIQDRSTELMSMMAIQHTRHIPAPPIAFAIGDFALWLLDSGATSHFTPVFSDLIDPQELSPPVYIRVADGSRLTASHMGTVELHFNGNNGTPIVLRMLRVLFVNGLQTRLFSIESFVSNGRFKATYSKGNVTLTFRENISIDIPLPHVPPGTYVSRETKEIANNYEHGFETRIHRDPRVNDNFVELDGDSLETASHFIGMAKECNLVDDQQNSGGQDATPWKPTNWDEDKNKPTKRRMNVELGHAIFGHRAINSLMAASKAQVWDDIEMIFSGDSWCDMCKIAIAPRSQVSKKPMRLNAKPLEYLFMDLIPVPAIMRGLKECSAKDFLFIVDPISKYADKLNVEDKTTSETIRVLKDWRGKMLQKGFQLFLFIRTDAGSNFTSKEFKDWCNSNNIQLSIAGPKHQEQNAFAERAYGTASRMARSMLVRAHLPLCFYHLSLKYALKLMRVLPAKGLYDKNNEPTTTYAILHGKKPRIGRFKVFGCPCVFKRYAPMYDGETSTKFTQLQRGCRGIFVGFPETQAGWLIYIHDKLDNVNLVVSSDVVFDQHFVSSADGIDQEFKHSQKSKKLGKSGGRKGEITEHTGDITTITDTEISHWGQKQTFETTHNVNNSKVFKDPNNPFDDLNDNNEDSESESDDDNEDDIIPELEDTSDYSNTRGTGMIDGVRRSRRLTESANTSSLLMYAQEQAEHIDSDIELVFTTIMDIASKDDVDITPYLPEPRNHRQIMQCPEQIRKAWLKAVFKEMKFLVENGTFRKGEPQTKTDECIPAIMVFKAKITSKGYLDKLKARCVARGDMQEKSAPEETWAPCVFGRTFKMFVCMAVRFLRTIKQLDFIGAFCQGNMQKRLFLQLPREYAQHMPQYKEYFDSPVLLNKSIYGTDFAHKVFSDDLCEWLLGNDEMPFNNSEVDPALFVYRNKQEFLFLICYVDDCLYFGSSDEIEMKLGAMLKKRFSLELQGNAHWFLGTRIYRENDGSYIIDQETYAKHVLNRYCGPESPWGLPPMQETPAPIDYVYTKENRPITTEDKQEVEKRYPDLSMASAVSSLLYIALNTRCDILWIVNKLAKSSSNPGLKDFAALLHCFGYLRKHTDFAIKYYAKIEESPVYDICTRNKIISTEIVGFSDSSWQDCPDTGRSTGGFKIFVQGGLIEANSCLPIPVALSTAESEYMSCCNLGAMVCHLRELMYDFLFLGTTTYDRSGTCGKTPSILLIDNTATVQMSKNYKVTAKNRHVGRRWHFVRRGVKDRLFELHWIPAKDQLADDLTKTQLSKVSMPHVLRTLLKLPNKVRGYKSDTVGNR